MKMTVKEFVKLDLTSLMQVNGGTSACGNYTQTQPAPPPSGGNETDNAPSNNGGDTGGSENTNDTPSSYSPDYSNGGTTGTTTGTCGGSGGQTPPPENPPKTNDKPDNDATNNNNDNNGCGTSVGGCSSINGGNGNEDGAELKGKKAKEEDDVVANDLPTDPSTPPEQPSSPNSPTTAPSDGSTGNQDNGNDMSNSNAQNDSTSKIFKSISENDDKKYICTGNSATDYRCDNWVQEVLTDAGYNYSDYYAGDANTTNCETHIANLKEKGGYTTSVPTKEGVYVVLMNDGKSYTKENGETGYYAAHTGLLVVQGNDSYFIDNSSGNNKKTGGIEKTTGGSTAEIMAQFGYNSFYYQEVK